MTDAQRLKDLAVSDSGFVFDPFTGETYSVNATGTAILRALLAGEDRQAIRQRLEHHFDLADNETPPRNDSEMRGLDLERDLDDFLRQLRGHRLIPDDFDVPKSPKE